MLLGEAGRIKTIYFKIVFDIMGNKISEEKAF